MVVMHAMRSNLKETRTVSDGEERLGRGEGKGKVKGSHTDQGYGNELLKIPVM
jgi:hypothetical protein